MSDDEATGFDNLDLAGSDDEEATGFGSEEVAGTDTPAVHVVRLIGFF